MQSTIPQPVLVIISITPSPRTPESLQIRVGAAASPEPTGTRHSGRGRIVASLSPKGVEALSLVAGRVFTEELRNAVEQRVLYERARRQATGWLVKRGLPRARVGARLGRFKLSPDDQAALLAELESLGLIDDAGLASRAAAARIERAPIARDMLSATLRRRGISANDADDAAREATQGRNPLSDAKALAVKRVRTFAATLDDVAAQRRLFAYLARRGYDEETAVAAVEHAMRRRY